MYEVVAILDGERVSIGIMPAEHAALLRQRFGCEVELLIVRSTLTAVLGEPPLAIHLL